jgi:hypothetical protein
VSNVNFVASGFGVGDGEAVAMALIVRSRFARRPRRASQVGARTSR